MRRRWLDPLLVAAAGLSVVGFVRSLWVVSPMAANLPEPLRREGLQLAGYRSLKKPTIPTRRERDWTWSPTHRYQLVPAKGKPVDVEMVVRRSRNWEGMALQKWKGATTVEISPNQQLRRRKTGGKDELQACLVGRGRGETGASALVEGKALHSAVLRWRDRLDRPAPGREEWLRIAAIAGGLRVSERWECLLVTLNVEGGGQQNETDALLLGVWSRLYPQLAAWGERWEGVAY